MNEQDTDKLIETLSDDLKSVKPLPHPLLRVLPYIVFAAIYVGILVYFVGTRPDLNIQLSDAGFITENALMIFIVLSAALAASFLSVPDMCGAKWLPVLPLTAAGAFIVWSAIRVYAEGLHMPTLHFDHCMGEGGFMAVVPLTMVVFMIRKGATTRPIMTAVMNILFAAGLGYIGLRFTCMMDTVGHTAVSHLGPYVIIGALLGVWARKLYKW